MDPIVTFMILLTGVTPGIELPGFVFTNSHAVGTDYHTNRNSLLTGQYPQRGATTRITDVLGPDQLEVIELETITELPELNQVVCCAELTGRFSIFWPGVAESGESKELTSLIDIAPTLAAIAGCDVRPNSQLSFDGLNLVPTIRFGAAGHGALFFEDERILTPNGYREDPSDWDFWRQMVSQQGPLM